MNMTTIPEPEHSIQSLIDKYHESTKENPREHLGCSLLGYECDRYIWLSFRWAVITKFSGRMLRLFRRGQNEETTIIKDLENIGIKFKRLENGKQHTVNFGSHVSGSMDGIILSGVPGSPTKKHIAEFKTHSLKSFKELSEKGVEKAKFNHFIQVQLYMHGSGIDRALYVGVCKDNDELHIERIKYNKEIAEKYLERGKRIALSDEVPSRLSESPSWYKCKMCDAYEFCHVTKTTKEINCRTCAFSTANEKSEFICEKFKDSIPVNFQMTGCHSHVLHPHLIQFEQIDVINDFTSVLLIDGKKVLNGEPSDNVFSSKEIIANPMACANPDNTIKELRKAFDARIGQ